MKMILEFDDLHPNPSVDCRAVIENTILCFKDVPFVLNFFVPAKYDNDPLYTYKHWCDKLRGYIGTGKICLGVHGLLHSPEEMLHKSYQEVVSTIKEAESIFHAAQLPFVKAFRAPQWSIGASTVEALVDLGYSHIYSHTRFNELTAPYAARIKVVNYNFNFKDEFPNMENPMGESGICVAHGHTSVYPHLSCGNGIWDQEAKLHSLLREPHEFLRIDQWE